MKRAQAILILTLCVIVLTSCTPAAIQIPAPSKGPKDTEGIMLPQTRAGELKTPEAAVACFVNGLKKNDFLGSLKAFAIYEIPDRLDYNAYSDRLKVVYMNAGYLPVQYKELNRASVLGFAANCYKSAVMSLCGLDWSKLQVQESPDDTAKFIEDVSPDKLAGTTLKMVDMESTLSNDMKPKHRENMEIDAKIYGADACRIYFVTLEANGNKAECGSMMLLQYGGNWKIASGYFTLPGSN
jgi:hypothetical protein